MGLILACLDGSRYSSAVCDYAAWFGDHLQDAITLLHVDEPARGDADAPASILADAHDRLKHHGVRATASLAPHGRFLEKLAQLAPGADLVLLGKRGHHATGGGSLGENVEAAIRRTTTPLCLVSSVFLPVSRALVVLDADPDHRRAVEFVAAHPALAALELDLVVMTNESAPGERKLRWAREKVDGMRAEVFSMSAQDPGQVAMRYAERGGFDLLIVSREAAFGRPPGSEPLTDFLTQRASILIC